MPSVNSSKISNLVQLLDGRNKVVLTGIFKIYCWKQYDCVSAPLNFNGVAFSWWNDRNGVARYFWSGSSNSSIRQPICQCGIEQNCVDDFLPCNCDSVLPSQLSDIGTYCSLLWRDIHPYYSTTHNCHNCIEFPHNISIVIIEYILTQLILYPGLRYLN